MAEEKKIPEKQGWFKKLINWFKNLPGRIATAFKNMVAELRKVTWPSKKKLISSCITVLLFMVFTGVVVGLLDMGSAAVVNGLDDLGNAITAEAPAEETDDTPGAENGTESTGDEAATDEAQPTEVPAEATDVPAEGTDDAAEVPAE